MWEFLQENFCDENEFKSEKWQFWVILIIMSAIFGCVGAIIFNLPVIIDLIFNQMKGGNN